MKKRFLPLIIVILLLTALSAAMFTACNDGEKRTPVNFTLDPDRNYGLYWYDVNGGRMLSQEDMPLSYYDPSKPTVIYSHGWKVDLAPEELVTQQSTIAATEGLSGDRDYAEELKKAGYNVGYFDWHLYAADLGSLQNEIWTVYEEGVSDAPDEGSNYEAAVAALDGKSFAGEFAREVAVVMKDAKNDDLYFIGHSFGGQMVTAAAYTLSKMYDAGLDINPACVPKRISLADPYIPMVDLSGRMDITGEKLECYLPSFNADAFAYLRGKGTFIDMYGSMVYNMYEFGPNGKKITSAIRANIAFVQLNGMNEDFPDTAAKHVNARDYVLTNLVDSIDAPLATLPFSVSVSAKEGAQFVGKTYYQQGPGFDWSATSYDHA